MRITQSRIKQIIKEELKRVLKEDNDNPYGDTPVSDTVAGAQLRSLGMLDEIWGGEGDDMISGTVESSDDFDDMSREIDRIVGEITADSGPILAKEDDDQDDSHTGE
jgi:hypothetical protein